MADSVSFTKVFDAVTKTASRSWRVGAVAFFIALVVLLPAEFSLHHLEEHCGNLVRSLAVLKPELLIESTKLPDMRSCQPFLVPVVATIRDIGIGLVVSVFAALLYEVAVHGLGLAEKSAKLDKNIETLEKLVVTNKAKDEPTFHSLILRHIDNLDPSLCGTLAKLLNEAHALSAVKDGQHYARFFSWYLEQAATTPAMSLRRMLAARRTDPFEYQPVDDAELSLRILGTQMKYMGQNCRYDSFASLRLYESPHHPQYVAETKSAVVRGLRIRRIYNVIALQNRLAAGQQERSAEHYSTLIEQQRLDIGPDFYAQGLIEVRFFTQADAVRCKGRVSHLLRAVRANRELEELYFGRFQFGEAGERVRVFVAHSPTGNVSVTPLASTEDAWAGVFNELWACSSTTNPFSA